MSTKLLVLQSGKRIFEYEMKVKTEDNSLVVEAQRALAEFRRLNPIVSLFDPEISIRFEWPRSGCADGLPTASLLTEIQTEALPGASPCQLSATSGHSARYDLGKNISPQPPPSSRRDLLCQDHGTGHRPWLIALLARRPTKVLGRISKQDRDLRSLEQQEKSWWRPVHR